MLLRRLRRLVLRRLLLRRLLLRSSNRLCTRWSYTRKFGVLHVTVSRQGRAPCTASWAGCRAGCRAVAEPFVGTTVETFAQTIEWVSQGHCRAVRIDDCMGDCGAVVEPLQSRRRTVEEPSKSRRRAVEEPSKSYRRAVRRRCRAVYIGDSELFLPTIVWATVWAIVEPFVELFVEPLQSHYRAVIEPLQGRYRAVTEPIVELLQSRLQSCCRAIRRAVVKTIVRATIRGMVEPLQRQCRTLQRRYRAVVETIQSRSQRQYRAVRRDDAGSQRRCRAVRRDDIGSQRGCRFVETIQGRLQTQYSRLYGRIQGDYMGRGKPSQRRL